MNEARQTASRSMFTVGAARASGTAKSRPVRIAHVALQLDTGGMERLLVEFARHADRVRFDLQFVALSSRGRIAADIESAGWAVTAMETRPGVRLSLIFKLARFFREQRIDIVHTHNTKPLLYAAPAARLAGVTMVVHTRHGQRYGATRRHDRLFRFAARWADRIVCVSDDSLRLCCVEGVDPCSIRRIWNGIDADRFRCAGPSIHGPALFVGRLSPEKDVATLLKAAAIVIERRPSFRLQIAGTGPSEAQLGSVAASLGLNDHVEFLGEVSDVPSLLASASLFVLPSVTEGLSLAVLEAMACGLPVVATRVGGTPEAVVDGQSGLLVEPGDPKQLARALLRVCGEPELGRAMGRVGRRRIEEHFDVGAMVARYESLYEEVQRTKAALAA